MGRLDFIGARKQHKIISYKKARLMRAFIYAILIIYAVLLIYGLRLLRGELDLERVLVLAVGTASGVLTSITVNPFSLPS